jgi:BioD-like phosphotransacetylase family protein
MCKKIFIGATGQHCGKTTISLSLMHLARKKYKSVGFIKPVGPKCVQYKGFTMDIDAAMIASVYNLDDDIHLMSPLTLTHDSTKKYIDGLLSPEFPARVIQKAVKELEQKHDFLIIEGAGHCVGMNNAQVAKLVDAPVMIVTGGGIGSVIDSVELNLALYKDAEADVRFMMLNKLVAEKKNSSLHYMHKYFDTKGIKVTSSYNFSPILANPTLQHVADLLEQPLLGDQRDRSRICHTIQLGAASSQRVIDLLDHSTLLIVTTSRDELIVTASSLHHIPAFKDRLAGLVVCGKVPMSRITQQILEDSNIPYIRITDVSADVFYRLKEHVSKIGPDDFEKINLINSDAEQYIDFEAIDSML